MKHPPRFKATIKENCGLEMGNVARWRDYIRSLKVGSHVWLTVETETNKRSISQHRYYHMYLDLISEETGEVHDDLHEVFKRRFLPPKFVHYKGQEVKIPRSTTDLSKGEFSEYLDRICAETGVPLPNPEDAGFITNY